MTNALLLLLSGTGSISNLFYVFPYGKGADGMKVMSMIFFFLNLLLFVVFSVITATRYILFPDIWRIMIRHPVQSLYTGTFPMGATTLLNVAVNLINRDYNVGGKNLLYTLWALWWLDVVISVVCCWGQVHYMSV
jgi:tellurite resistance protein TehA-like permease